MYGWLWRHIPGPTGLRVLMLAVVLFALLAVSFLWVFPAIAPLMPFNGSTVGAGP